jgi:thiamine-phosphate pyrophosphorylase
VDPRLDRLQGVYVIADDAPHWRHSMERVVEAAVRAGVSCLQLRFKHARDGEALARARALTSRARAAGLLVLVNDRFDLADLAGADGVHLGDRDLAPERIPDELRKRLLVGGSTHTLQQVEHSRSRPLDYIGFGPVFATASKLSAHEPRTPAVLARAVALAGRPVVAIGGIDRAGIASVLAAGAAAAAVISAVHSAEDPEAALRELRDLCHAPPA